MYFLTTTCTAFSEQITFCLILALAQPLYFMFVAHHFRNLPRRAACRSCLDFDTLESMVLLRQR